MNSNPNQSPYTSVDGAQSIDVRSGSMPSPTTGATGVALGGTRPLHALDVPAAPIPTAVTNDNSSRLAEELQKFQKVARDLRANFSPATDFEARCRQAFDVANDLFGNAPTWVCFYRELMGGDGMIPMLFPKHDDFGNFLRSEQYHQIQLMLTALRSRDLPENDPNDPQRMITVRLPKSLHEALCDEAVRLGISVNRLCISRMLQLLDPKMIPETASKPRGRKPRSRTSPTPAT